MERTQAKTLSLKQAWFLGVGAAAVIAMFAFVIVPYLGPRQPAFSGKAIPDVSLPLLSGGAPGDRVRLADYRGRVVVLDFWASWCRPCREQTKMLVDISGKWGEKVVFLGVDEGEPEADGRAFLEKFPTPYSNAYDEGGKFGRELSVNELPSIFVLDRRGTIVAHVNRLITERELEQMIEGALK